MKTTFREENGKYIATLEGRLDTVASEQTAKDLSPLKDCTGHDIIIDCTNLEYISIDTLKYGWFYNAEEAENLLDNDTLGDITNWTYIQHENGENEFIASINYTQSSGYYYLCTMINNKAFWIQEPIIIEEN